MEVGLSLTDCDEAGDYVVPNVLNPRDLVSRSNNMDETRKLYYTIFLRPLIYVKNSFLLSILSI